MKDAWGYSNENYPVAKGSWLAVWLPACFSFFIYFGGGAKSVLIFTSSHCGPSVLLSGMLDTENLLTQNYPYNANLHRAGVWAEWAAFRPLAPLNPSLKTAWCIQKATKDSKVDRQCVWEIQQLKSIVLCGVGLHRAAPEKEKRKRTKRGRLPESGEATGKSLSSEEFFKEWCVSVTWCVFKHIVKYVEMYVVLDTLNISRATKPTRSPPPLHHRPVEDENKPPPNPLIQLHNSLMTNHSPLPPGSACPDVPQSEVETNTILLHERIADPRGFLYLYTPH